MRRLVDRGISRLTGARPSTIQHIYKLESHTIEEFIGEVRRQLEEKMISTQRSIIYPVTQVVIKSTSGLMTIWPSQWTVNIFIWSGSFPARLRKPNRLAFNVSCGTTKPLQSNTVKERIYSLATQYTLPRSAI